MVVWEANDYQVSWRENWIHCQQFFLANGVIMRAWMEETCINARKSTKGKWFLNIYEYNSMYSQDQTRRAPASYSNCNHNTQA